MIKNIVFDMGNVLLDYNPRRLISKVFPQPSEQALILREVFQSEGWRKLDQGLITFEEHYDYLAMRYPQYAEKIDWLLKNWHKDQPYITGIHDLVLSLTNAGYDLYILSNANTRFYKFETYIDIFKFFKGITLSSELKLIKPQREIFDKFCQIHQLTPGECLFIDDQKRNVESAIDSGWQAHQFIDVQELRDYLTNHMGMQF